MEGTQYGKPKRDSKGIERMEGKNGREKWKGMGGENGRELEGKSGRE